MSLSLSAQSLLPQSNHLSPPPLDADRPGYTEPTGTLTPGFRQMEGGYFRSVEKDHSHSLSLPAPLIRYGITPRFELRVQTDGFISLDKVVLNRGAEHHNGAAGLAAGFKLRLRDERKPTPALSLIFMLGAPSGHRRQLQLRLLDHRLEPPAPLRSIFHPGPFSRSTHFSLR